MDKVPPIVTRTDTLFPFTALCLSCRYDLLGELLGELWARICAKAAGSAGDRPGMALVQQLGEACRPRPGGRSHLVRHAALVARRRIAIRITIEHAESHRHLRDRKSVV